MFEFLFKYSRETFARSEFLFASGWPVWLLVALIVVAAFALGASLLRNRHDLPWLKLGVIGVLELALVATLLVMLWRPALLTQTLRAGENTVAILLDTSASMSYGEGERSRLQLAVAALEDDTLPGLESQFDVELLGFAGQSFALPSLDEVPVPGTRTDIGEALLGVERGASAGALAAIVLVSDGADNSGALDPARLAEIASFGVPVHTLGVGREVLEEDLELEDVQLAPQSSAGATVSAQVSIRHGRGALAQLKVYDGDAILASEAIQLPDEPGVTTRWIDLEVGEAGIRDLRFAIDAIPGETNLINNVQQRPLEVPERRRSIFYYEGEPRWEYKFIRRAFDEESAIRIASLIRTTPNKDYRQGLSSGRELADGFPTEAEELFDYDAVIVGSLEAAALTEEQQQLLYDFVSERGGTLLLLGGQRGLADGGWGATKVGELLPAELPLAEERTFLRADASAEPFAVLPEDTPSLITRLDADDEANAEIWAGMPGLADIQLIERDSLKHGAEVLLEASYLGELWPLLIRHRFGQGTVYVLATSGTWRWQMLLDHTDMKHETFWRQLAQALTASVPEPVTLSTERVYYGDESVVTFRADVRDQEYAPATDATVSLQVDFPGGAVETLTMEAVPGVPGRYESTLEAAPTGIYRVVAEARTTRVAPDEAAPDEADPEETATAEAAVAAAGTEERGTAEAATAESESLGRSRLAIRREDGVSEHFRVQQNRALLERIAASTGGRYFTLDEADEIPEAVQFSDAGIVERRLLELWNMPFFFLLLVVLKSGEWLLRLWWGRL